MPIHLAMALMLGLPAPAPPQGGDAAQPHIERLGPSIAFVEDKSLPFNSHAPRMVVSIPAELEEMDVPASAKADGTFRNNPETYIKDVNAMRILAFMTQPGEKVAFSLKSEHSKVRLAVYTDPKAAKMKAAIKRANMPPNASRSKKLVFTNTTKEPYEMLLLVYGLHGHQYSLGWEREPKK